MALIDSEFVAGRFLVHVPLPDGTRIRLLADTGGGLTVAPDVVAALPRVPHAHDPGLYGVRLPLDPPVAVGSDVAFLLPPRNDYDGVLGACWFADRVWVFDYVAGRLEVLDRSPVCGPIAVGFPCRDGVRSAHYPRVEVTIDHDPLQLLLDTGATVALTDAGLQALGAGPRHRASSFIVSSVLDDWRTRHPDWPFIESAGRFDTADLIRVPSIGIGDTELGPVWFERRPDTNFHDCMSQWTDRRIDGALGGNAFAGRRLTIDYPRATAMV